MCIIDDIKLKIPLEPICFFIGYTSRPLGNQSRNYSESTLYPLEYKIYRWSLVLKNEGDVLRYLSSFRSSTTHPRYVLTKIDMRRYRKGKYQKKKKKTTNDQTKHDV